MCNRFRTHKRFKRLNFIKAMFWYYCFENKTDDSQPIGSFSPLGENNLIGSSLLSEHSHDWSEMEQPILIGSSLLSEHSSLSESSQMREIISESHKYGLNSLKYIHYLLKLQSVNLFHKFHMSSEILELVNFHTIFLQQPTSRRLPLSLL